MKSKLLLNAFMAMAMLCLYGTVQAQVIPNDHCTGAITVGCGSTVTGTTTGAYPGAPNSAPDVWYRMTGVSGIVTASLCGATNYDSYIKIWKQTVGGTPCTSFNSVAHNDNLCGVKSEVTWNANASDEYFIVISGPTVNDFGDFELAITCSGTNEPSNDKCEDATAIACNSSATGSTVYANPDMNHTSNGVWYTIQGTGLSMTVSTCVSGFDTRLWLYEGSCNNLNYVDDNDDYCGTSSQITWNSTLGTTYYILVNGYGSSNGSYVLTMECEESETPENDYCYSATDISCNQSIQGNTTNATTDFGSAIGSTGTQGVWYNVTGNGGTITANTCGTSWDTYLWVYSGHCKRLTYVTRNNNSWTCGFGSLQSAVSWYGQPGVEYYILVGGFAGASGPFTLSVSGNCLTPNQVGGEISMQKTAETPYELTAGAFPNPSKDFVDFQIDVPQSAEVSVRITDITGKVITTIDMGNVEAGMHKVRHNWNGIPAGIYLYQITSGSEQFNGKLQVVH